jgi:hypothetical protein
MFMEIVLCSYSEKLREGRLMRFPPCLAKVDLNQEMHNKQTKRQRRNIHRCAERKKKLVGFVRSVLGNFRCNNEPFMLYNKDSHPWIGAREWET